MEKKANYKCLIFIENKKELRKLRTGKRLYGKFITGTSTWILTPYPPPNSIDCEIFIIGSTCSGNGRLFIYRKNNNLKAYYKKSSTNLPVKLQIFTTADIYSRTPFDSREMEFLAKQSVTIIGCGTGGSKIALELARAGVKHFTLCDPDVMTTANLSRYEGDIFDIGKYKPKIVSELIYKVNPAAKVTTFCEDIFEKDVSQINSILKSNLIIASTDKTDIQLLINEFAYKLEIPCVFGGCYEEAKGGEVLFTLPEYKMPCLACLRAGLSQPEENSEIDYSTASGPDDYQGQPGLHSAVDLVTCIEVQISLAVLLRNVKSSKLAKLIDPKNNFLLIGGPGAAGFYRFKKPFDIFFQPLKSPRKDCHVCGNLSEIFNL